LKYFLINLKTLFCTQQKLAQGTFMNSFENTGS
jgi:hypothetical protein